MQDASDGSPPSNHIGVIAATVLLCYALAHLATSPEVTFAIQLPGFYFAYGVTLGSAMTLMAGGLTATGMVWLLRAGGRLEGRRSVEHWMIPTLTSLIIGIVLNVLPAGSSWWIGFFTGAVLLVAVLMAEYVAVDPEAPMYAMASAGLTALSYAIFLLFAIILRLGGARLFLVVPSIFVACGLVALRTLHLRFNDRWHYPWALGIGMACSQIAGGLHYWPLTPVQYGLAVLAPLLALTTLSAELSEDMPIRSALREPVIICAGLWAAAVVLH